MNCNSNTMPLINTSEPISCNNGCAPKDINVVCRAIIIPTGQEILGVQGDIGSISRTFVLPKTTEEGYDLSNKTFAIILQNDEGEQWNENIPFENIEETENYIKIKWDLKAKDTQVAGDLKVSIKVSSEDFVWQTYVTSFVIQSSLIDPGEIPAPLNLQEKIVEPTKDTQIITYDKGYEGLRNVTVNGDESLISKNIKSGVTIFGVNGDTNVVDTLDGNIEAQDVQEGKIAYAKGNKIIGTNKSSEYNAKISTKIGAGGTNYSGISKAIIEPPKNLELSNGAYTFYYCTSLKKISSLELREEARSVQNMFYNCISLTEIPEFYVGNVSVVTGFLFDCGSLINLGGFKDLGKAYLNKQANYLHYTLTLSACTKLTHDSLMNVINDLYDLNLTYGVAQGGTLYTQRLVLGSTNIAKLTEEELQIAQDKGWTIV